MNPDQTDHDHIVLIDIGNTRIKAGWLHRASGKREQQTLAVEHRNAVDVIAWLNAQDIQISAAMGVNVAGPDVAQSVHTLFSQAFSVTVQWLSSQRQAAQVINRYRDPAQLGADRWLSMIGLSQLKSDMTAPRLLASFGTATTLDTLCPASLARRTHNTCHILHGTSPEEVMPWVYDGGLIFPGPALMRTSLANSTAQLPDANGPTAAFPDNTHQAITSGIAAAQAGALIRQWQAGLSQYGVAPEVYCTGGGWPEIQTEAQSLLATMQRHYQQVERPIQHLPSPILDGLACMAQQNG